jgi:hypothetical protein
MGIRELVNGHVMVMYGHRWTFVRPVGKRVGFTPSRVRISYPPPVDSGKRSDRVSSRGKCGAGFVQLLSQLGAARAALCGRGRTPVNGDGQRAGSEMSRRPPRKRSLFACCEQEDLLIFRVSTTASFPTGGKRTGPTLALSQARGAAATSSAGRAMGSTPARGALACTRRNVGR